MKKIYTTPVIIEEKFMAEEYVSACWGVGCSCDAANNYEKSINNYDKTHLSHAYDHCGLSTNQAIGTDSNNIAISMTECRTDGLGDLACTIYTDNTYSIVKNVSEVKSGDYIYWTTSAGTKTWHHQGYVESTYSGHPNRS